MEDPRIAAAQLRASAEAEADSIMEEFAGSSPQSLAEGLMQKREVYDQGPDFAYHVAEVLRGRRAEWLKGRRWPEGRDAIAGRPELTRTPDGAQVQPDKDD